MKDDSFASHLELEGYASVAGVLDQEEIESLRRAFATTGSRAGQRDILSIPEVASLLASPRIRATVEPILGAGAKAVKGIYFDKNPQANWTVPWHQDVTIAVRSRHDVPGFGPWSTKDGTTHVQPPAQILEGILTVRLHLDDCGADNGALRVIPRSHTRGKFSATEIDEWARHDAVTCEASEGDALLMRPLLLHASSPAVSPRHRRVIHLEFSALDLPDPLQWAG